jgi:hypothetical protein
MSYWTTDRSRVNRRLDFKPVTQPPQPYATKMSYDEKLNEHAKCVLKKAVGLVKPHINSKNSNFLILNEESQYLQSEIEKDASFTHECSNSFDFYKSMDIKTPEDFHQKLCSSIYSSMRNAWSDYNQKNYVVSGEGFQRFVDKHMTNYLPVMSITAGKLGKTSNIGPAQLLPPIHPPGMRLQGVGKFAISPKRPAISQRPPSFKLIQSKEDDSMNSSMPALKPLVQTANDDVYSDFIEGHKKEKEHKEKSHKKEKKHMKEPLPPMPALIPLVECPKKKKKHESDESDDDDMKSQFSTRETLGLPKLIPIQGEMPQLEPIENEMSELVSFEQEDLIEGPRDWARKKKQQYKEHAADKSEAKADKAKAKADLEEAKAAAKRKSAEADKARYEKSNERRSARRTGDMMSVRWLQQHLQGEPGFEKLSLPEGQSYVYMASTDEMITKLLARQKECNGILDTFGFVKSHLGVKPEQSMINASIRMLSGAIVEKVGKNITKPALNNPEIISAEKLTIGSNDFTVLVHDNVLPKAK